MKERCGYIALMGEPNAGKSTLLNQLLKVKLSIVTHKVQTTRRRILGVYNDDKSKTQIVFLDTPGLFNAKRTLEKAMVKSAWSCAKDADVLAFIIDVTKKDLSQSKKIFQDLLNLNKPTFLILNKIDEIDKALLLPMSADFASDSRVMGVFMISALHNLGVDTMLSKFSDMMPESDWLFKEDQLSDLPLKVLVAEITREKIFINVHQELPYQTTVQTESWEDFRDGSLKISQVIHVSKESYKKIILGVGGERLKRIGIQARKDIESFLYRKVHLQLFIRVTDDWMYRLQELEVIGDIDSHMDQK